MFFDVAGSGMGGLALPDPLAAPRRRATMPADVVEDESTFHLLMDIPGCQEADINLEVDGQVIRVSAEYKVPAHLGGEELKWHRAGRPFGIHSRALRFPESCDMTKVQAQFRNGTLCVTIPKTEGGKVCPPRRGGAAGLTRPQVHRIAIAASGQPAQIGQAQPVGGV